jgi:hypothetical protein
MAKRVSAVLTWILKFALDLERSVGAAGRGRNWLAADVDHVVDGASSCGTLSQCESVRRSACASFQSLASNPISNENARGFRSSLFPAATRLGC